MPTANDRFKQGFATWFWAALIVATLLHAALFLLGPTFALDAVARPTTGLEMLDLPDRLELPPEPEAIARPVAPVPADVDIDDAFTIPPTTLGDNPPELLAPPPARDDALESGPVATPMTIRPRLRNSAEIARALVRLYPAILRDAGIGGTVTVWCFIDEEGRVLRTQVDRPSGYEALDAAALQVAGRMTFTPAYNRDQRVPVWVSIPIVFEAVR